MRSHLLPFCMLFWMCCATETATTPFEILAVLDVGLNPHQIAFQDAGATALVAAAGSDRITIVNANTLTVQGSIPVADAPLGVAALDDGGFAATRFGADEVVRFSAGDSAANARVTTGGAPSLLYGPLPTGHYLVSVEQSNLIWWLDPISFTLSKSFAVGNRPFPPAATSDGHLVFVPNYDDGTVSVVDVPNDRITTTIAVGDRPSGGAVLPGDSLYLVAVRGQDKIAIIDTRSLHVIDSITRGIGQSPFSVVVSVDGRLAFVNNTASSDVSVIDVASRTVTARILVGEQPIVMGVHPSGESLWVSSEGSDELTIITIHDAREH